ncbi:MAG: GspH/FimT family pseudopilin [Legionellales bacterium]|nr:GspH/FimT family pseudopilin [Legionellales bacterium]
MKHLPYSQHSPPICWEGVTLIELIVTICVMAILVMIAIPSFQTLIQNNRITSQTNALFHALNYARNTALTQNMNVLACPAGTLSSTTCGTSWSNGWIIVSQPSPGVPVLLQAHFSGPHDPTLSNVPIGGVATTSVTFDSRGIATTQAYFKVCDVRGGAYAQSVEVLPTGFIQVGSTMGTAVWDASALACP